MTLEIFRRPECLFMFCPHPATCQEKCLHTAAQAKAVADDRSTPKDTGATK